MESSTDDRALLRELAARWAQYQSMLRDFPRPFHYLVGVVGGVSVGVVGGVGRGCGGRIVVGWAG
jgi:hypothetical protein